MTELEEQLSYFREPAPLLVIENGNWGATSLRTIHGVLTSAAQVLLAGFGSVPDAAIHVAPWRRNPRVFNDRRPYQVRLSARDTYWCQYVYQFAHELCHVMTNFDRHRAHKHRWFNEALCELASLFVLHRLAETWAARPPDGVAQAAAYAPNFARYGARMAQRHSRPADRPRWLAAHLPELEADPYARDRNGVLAVTLLQPFLDDPSLWRDCGLLNCWDPYADATFRDYLDSWAHRLTRSRSTPRVAPLIGALFHHPRASPGGARPPAPGTPDAARP